MKRADGRSISATADQRELTRQPSFGPTTNDTGRRVILGLTLYIFSLKHYGAYRSEEAGSAAGNLPSKTDARAAIDEQTERHELSLVGDFIQE